MNINRIGIADLHQIFDFELNNANHVAGSYSHDLFHKINDLIILEVRFVFNNRKLQKINAITLIIGLIPTVIQIGWIFHHRKHIELNVHDFRQI
ncbi:hypothetical protein D3C87_1817980 [compost metagenome]